MVAFKAWKNRSKSFLKIHGNLWLPHFFPQGVNWSLGVVSSCLASHTAPVCDREEKEEEPIKLSQGNWENSFSLKNSSFKVPSGGKAVYFLAVSITKERKEMYLSGPLGQRRGLEWGEKGQRLLWLGWDCESNLMIATSKKGCWLECMLGHVLSTFWLLATYQLVYGRFPCKRLTWKRLSSQPEEKVIKFFHHLWDQEVFKPTMVEWFIWENRLFSTFKTCWDSHFHYCHMLPPSFLPTKVVPRA